jgi:hypothetical protein
VRFIKSLTIFFVPHKDEASGNEMSVNTIAKVLEFLRSCAAMIVEGAGHESQCQKLGIQFPLEAAAGETPDAMLAVLRGRHLLQSGRTNWDRRRSDVADYGDMPNVGITIKIE